MQNMAGNTLLKNPSEPVGSKLSSKMLDSFCQLQIEQIVAQAPIVLAKIVYYDPFLNEHQEVASQSNNSFFAHTEASLKSGIQLLNFPPVLVLTELPLAQPDLQAYVCPIGYRNCQPEYLLVVTREPLSSVLQDYLAKCAALIIKYLELYFSFYHQNTETQLLEHIVHRVGHQLRNPLSLIALYAENLRLELFSSRVQEQAVVIRETVQNLLENLTDLIYCGKSSQLKISLQDIRTLVNESAQDLQPWIEEKKLKIVCSSIPTLLRIDRIQMKQVFSNLLHNAIHFSPDSGTIAINWQVFQEEVLVQITDQGKGLSDSDLQKIFTPFYSQRPGGTGLGLTIAKKIVLDHQGSLWAQNLPEGGAQFSFTLPRFITTQEHL